MSSFSSSPLSFFLAFSQLDSLSLRLESPSLSFSSPLLPSPTLFPVSPSTFALLPFFVFSSSSLRTPIRRSSSLHVTPSSSPTHTSAPPIISYYLCPLSFFARVSQIHRLRLWSEFLNTLFSNPETFFSPCLKASAFVILAPNFTRGSAYVVNQGFDVWSRFDKD
ncbi:hypothetical protein SLA2020_084120 [Shorea laevis]